MVCPVIWLLGNICEGKNYSTFNSNSSDIYNFARINYDNLKRTSTIFQGQSIRNAVSILSETNTNYKIIWIVRAFWLVYKWYEARKWREQYGWLFFQVVRIYSFMNEIKVCIRASYIVFLNVKTENINFIKEIKHVFRAFIAWWKPRQSLWKFSSRWKILNASRVVADLRSPRF